eukprot:9896279-Alexandrium_andersonii.AAC.1
MDTGAARPAGAAGVAVPRASRAARDEGEDDDARSSRSLRRLAAAKRNAAKDIAALRAPTTCIKWAASTSG